MGSARATLASPRSAHRDSPACNRPRRNRRGCAPARKAANPGAALEPGGCEVDRRRHARECMSEEGDCSSGEISMVEIAAENIHIDPVFAAATMSMRCRSSLLRARSTAACSSTRSTASSGKSSQRVYHRPADKVCGTVRHTIEKDCKADSDESSERILPFVPKVWEMYILFALPIAPFILFMILLGPLLLEE